MKFSRNNAAFIKDTGRASAVASQPSLFAHLRGRGRESSNVRRQGGFTLIEMLAVLVIILIIAGATIGGAGYVQNKIRNSRARAEISAMEMALEAYKLDWGYYPYTSTNRGSTDYSVEMANSYVLYRALALGPKKYYTFPSGRVTTNRPYGSGGYYANYAVVPWIVDPFAKPYNYYCPSIPITASTVQSNQSTLWPFDWNYTITTKQMNQTSFDLWSYGPDNKTYLPGVPAGEKYGWGKSTISNDDITNWK